MMGRLLCVWTGVTHLYAQNATFTVKVQGYDPAKKYIDKVFLNGRPLDRNWLTHEEISNGGELVIHVSSIPDLGFGVQNQWQSQLDE